MNRQTIERRLKKAKLFPGKLLKLKIKKSFWIDGSEPSIIQPLFDENQRVIREYLSGGNSWKTVEAGDILLFLGVFSVPVIQKEQGCPLLQEEYFVLKWLVNKEVVFWSFDLRSYVSVFAKAFEEIDESTRAFGGVGTEIGDVGY